MWWGDSMKRVLPPLHSHLHVSHYLSAIRSDGHLNRKLLDMEHSMSCDHSQACSRGCCIIHTFYRWCLGRHSLSWKMLWWSSLQIWVPVAKVVDRSILGLISYKLTTWQWIWSIICYNWAKKRYCYGTPEHGHYHLSLHFQTIRRYHLDVSCDCMARWCLQVVNSLVEPSSKTYH